MRFIERPVRPPENSANDSLRIGIQGEITEFKKRLALLKERSAEFSRINSRLK